MNDIAIADVKVPAHIQKRMNQPSPLADKIGAGVTFGEAAPRISLKASRFRIVEDGEETILPETQIDVVFVGSNPRLSKVWYVSEWDPDAEATAPDCYSLDGVSPHPDAEQPQHDLCATCDSNAWGSKIAPNGTKLKACSDQKRMAVVAADNVDGPVYLLVVTPAALKGLGVYNKQLAQRGFPPDAIRTTLSFDPDASFPKLQFSFGGFLEDDAIEVVSKRTETDETRAITGERSESEVLAPPAAEPKGKTKPSISVVKDEVEDAEVVAETKPAPKGFGKPKAAPKAEAKAAPKAEAKPEPEVAAVEDAADPDIAALLAGIADDA